MPDTSIHLFQCGPGSQVLGGSRLPLTIVFSAVTLPTTVTNTLNCLMMVCMQLRLNVKSSTRIDLIVLMYVY